MQGESDQCTSERQEFSFTLYDFDGHGKITKDVSNANGSPVRTLSRLTRLNIVFIYKMRRSC